MERRRTTMGMAVDQCLSRASEEWFRQHAGMRSREEAACQDIKLVTVTCERRPGARLRIHVGMVTANRNTTTTDIYEFEHQGKLGYVETAPSKRVV